jgi:hypothetical protein
MKRIAFRNRLSISLPFLLSFVAPVLVAGAAVPAVARAQATQPCSYDVDFCNGTFRSGLLLFLYTGAGCASSRHGQTSVASCTGDSALADPVRVVFADGPDPDASGARRWFDGTVTRGQIVTVDAARGGATTLGATVWGFVFEGATLRQTVQIDVSCAQRLREDDQFGSFRLTRPRFPQIPVWSMAKAFNDGSATNRNTCVGSLTLPDDSVSAKPRVATVRFLRDRRAEARSDFGGYRIYRVTVTPDTARMMLVRRFSRQAGDERTWNFSVVDTSTLQFRCRGAVVHDSIVTFVDPDSSGNFVKISCRDEHGRLRVGCQQLGDSIIVLQTPPGPHDGFRTWYAVTYEERNQTLDANYQDLFVPDTLGIIGPCRTPGNPLTCPNLNSKCYNITAAAVEPTSGPTQNLERVAVVPNPFRARERWDAPGGGEIHFINLPPQVTIRIYTASGDLVREIEHTETTRDFARWDLKNASGRDVSSGIYMFRIESRSPGVFTYQDRFVVIR